MSYPVVYLLHGLPFGPNAPANNPDSVLTNGNIEDFTASLPADQQAIVVLPSSPGPGAWIDWRDGNHTYETALVDVLIPYVDSHFRTIPDRNHRAIAGVSFGGFGALHDAARHPDLFAAVGSFSGLDDVTDPVVEAGTSVDWPVFSAGCAVLSQSSPLSKCADNAGVQDVLPPSAWGDPVTGQWFFHDNNPGDMAVNFSGMSVWLASGNGIPCDPSTEVNSSTPQNAVIEAYLVRKTHVDLDADLTQAGVAHTSVFRSCGMHTWTYWRQDMAEWWPVMMRALGDSSPQTFNYRTMAPSFSVWGWHFSAETDRAHEFLTVEDASTDGLGLTGSGLTTVTTPPIFGPGSTVDLQGATTGSAVADPSGRITFQVDLGPAHAWDQYSVQATAAAAAANTTSTGYFTSRVVRFSQA